MNAKNLRADIEIASFCKNDLLDVTTMVKIDTPTCHEEVGNLHFILKVSFHCKFIGKKNMHFLKTCQCTVLWKYSILSN